MSFIVLSCLKRVVLLSLTYSYVITVALALPSPVFGNLPLLDTHAPDTFASPLAPRAMTTVPVNPAFLTPSLTPTSLPTSMTSSAMLDRPDTPLATPTGPMYTSSSSSPAPGVKQPPPISASDLNNQSGWDFDAISTVVFGCVASFLALSTLCVMLWLGLRRPPRARDRDIEMTMEGGLGRRAYNATVGNADEGWKGFDSLDGGGDNAVRMGENMVVAGWMRILHLPSIIP